MKNLQKMQDVLTEALRTPYSSAYSLYYITGKPSPEKLGFNCYEQSRRLERSLVREGLEGFRLQDTLVGRHLPTICIEGEHLVLLDPYLMHPEPIVLPRGRNFRAEASAYPVINGIQSKILVSMDRNLLSVEKTWPTSRRKDSFLFDLSKSNLIRITPEWYSNAVFHPEQTSLSVRAIDFEREDTVHCIYHLERRSWLVKSGKGTYFQGRQEFSNEMARLGGLIDSSPQEILDHISGAVEIWDRMSKSRSGTIGSK